VLNLGAREICERSGTSPEDFAALDDAIRGLQGDQEGLEGELKRLARQVRVRLWGEVSGAGSVDCATCGGSAGWPHG
jgi:hypothetical protein